VSGEAPIEGAPAAVEAEPSPAPRSAPPRRGRFARFAVLGCALAAAAVILPRIPRDRQIDFRIQDASSIVRIELAWSREDGDGEPVRGGSWHFEPGRAPRSLTTSVHLPNGRYAVDITVERTAGRDELHRVIELDSTDHVTIPVP
jgi:hypothetical protein